MPVSVTPLLGATPYPLARPTPSDSAHAKATVPCGEPSAPVRVLPLALQAAVASELSVPAPVTRPMPLPPTPVERMVFALGAPVPLAAVTGVNAPGFLVQTATPLLSRAESGRALQVATAPIVSHFVTPAVDMADPAALVRFPRLELAAIEPYLAPVPVPHAARHAGIKPVTDSLCATPADGVVDPAEFETRLPKFQISAFAPNLAPPPMPEPRTRWTPSTNGAVHSALPAPSAADVPPALLRLPGFQLPPVEAARHTVQIPEACEHWMPNLAAEPVMVEVIASAFPEMACAPAAMLPAITSLSVVSPWLPVSMRLKPALIAEPVSMKVWPQIAAVLAVYDQLPEIRIPDGTLLTTTSAGAQTAPDAPAASSLRPEPVECMVLPVSDTTLAEIASERPLHLPALFLPVLETGNLSASAVESLPAEPVETMPAFAPCAIAPFAAAPQLCLPLLPEPEAQVFSLLGSDVVGSFSLHAAIPESGRRPLPLNPVRTLFVEPPAAYQSQPAPAAVAARGFLALDFYCQRNSGSPINKVAWLAAANRPILPALTLHTILERVEEAPLPKKKDNGVAHIFSLPEVGRRKAGNKAVRYAIRTLAACLFLGSILWFGLGTLQIGSQTPAVNRDVSFGDLANSTRSRSLSPSFGSASGSGSRAGSQPSGPIARIRSAISDRAAASITDSFRNGMEAWGTASKQFAPGWSRNPDGYVQPGALALFHPSLNYKDYHLAFFGQIDSRSMGWAVRAHDPQNYYAMKLKVLEAGLRPVIAMVHYPVVGGKKGRPVEIPLNVMVHNNRPLQVDVEVHGDKLLTSVDGQLVDTWIDETLVAGGVGFFSEAGERARLYWMRVTKNEDFLGRICAYVSNTLGDGSRATAELWPPQIPDTPQPQPAPERTQEAALAATAAALQNRPIPNSRRESWNS